jgi:predicted DNA-binding protein with PD1-like motif
MQYQQDGATHIIVIDKGELFIETLTRYCTQAGIQNASFSGLGAVDQLECGYYALEEKRYSFTTYEEMVEVVSLTGNVMRKDDAPFVHVHGVFTDTQNNAFGGHIKEMRVGVTLEITLTAHHTSLSRQLNESIGLFLINCPPQQ